MKITYVLKSRHADQLERKVPHPGGTYQLGEMSHPT